MATWQSATSRSSRSTGRKLKPKVKARRPKAKAKPSTATPRPLDLTAPLNEDTLNQQVGAATALQFGGAEAELAGQRGVNAQMMRNIPSWFADYQNALAQATNRTQQAYGAALGVQQNMANTSSALDTQQRAALAQGLQADATTRGAQVDPALGIQSQQAASARRAMLDQYAGLTAGLGAAETGFRANRQVVGAGQGLSALMDETQRGRNIGTAAQNLAREKGQYAVKTRQDLINLEHTKDLERKAFGLNVAEAEADVAADVQASRDRAAARRLQSRNQRANRNLSAARLAEQQRHNRATEASVGGRGGLSPAEQQRRRRESQKLRNSIDTAAADARTGLGAIVPVIDPATGKPETGGDNKPTGRTRKATQAEIRATLRKKYKDRDIANAAMDLAVKGYVDVVNEKRLKARGIKIPRSWLAKRPRRKKTSGAVAVIQRGAPGMSRTNPNR
jgi:hypothetical protein